MIAATGRGMRPRRHRRPSRWRQLADRVAAHPALGRRFRVVGARERIGQHYGRWRDVVL